MINLLFAAAVVAQAPATPPAPTPAADHAGHADMAAPKTAMLMPGYGGGGFPTGTRNPRAQAFFDNGMQLAHAFAHNAAIEAMAEAVRLDPNCAMCLWGQAWASGPTINYGKNEQEIGELKDLADRAAELAEPRGNVRERAMIEALQLRYTDGGGGKPGDLNFAKAMTLLAAQYPDDKTLAVLTADAWLMTAANNRSEERLNAQLAMPLLERVLARDPNYTPAIHFYIHAAEAAGRSAQAERFADRLAGLAPRASHLVHMPSHTYYWVGRYQDAADVNVRAVQLGIDNARQLGLPEPDGVWGLPYHVHNVTFGLGGALMASDAKTALALGRPLVARSQGSTSAGPFRQLIAAGGYAAVGLFAPTAEVLALPAPKLPYLMAAWHHARGEAFARLGNAAGVRAEAAAIRAVPGETSLEDASMQAQQMTFIARNVLSGRAAMLEQRFAEAQAYFREAAELQENHDFSRFSDPPAWYYPVRRDLAAALLAAGNKAGARQEAEATLAYRPKDPGALALLGKLDAAKSAR